MTSANEFRILILEDAPDDVALINRELHRGGLEFVSSHVESRGEFLSQLEQFQPDLILADHALPAFDGFAALELAKGLRPDVPFIFVTGSMGEEVAIDTMKKGASDYVLKTRLANLVPAVVRALRERDERKKRLEAEASMRQSELRFRALIENSMDAIALLDPRGCLLYASPSTTRILGYPISDAMGRNAFALMHPEDRKKTRELFRHCLQQPGGGIRAQYRYRHQNRSWVWLEALGTNLLQEPGVQAFVANFRDITERKQTEVRLQLHASLEAAIAEFSKIVLVGIDPALLMDDAVELVAGTLRADHAAVFELLSDGSAFRLSSGSGWKNNLVGLATVNAGPDSPPGSAVLTNAAVVADDLPSETRLHWPLWMREHSVVSSACVPIKGRDRPFGVLSVHASQRRAWSEDELYFLEAVAYRLAAALERRKAQEEIARLNAQLEARVLERTAELKEAYHEMEAFSYSISHDLRAPLRHIGGFVELLQEESGAILPEQSRGYLRIIADATQHMGKLIDDLLELSRASCAEINKARVSLADLVASVQRALEMETRGRQIQWIIGKLPDVRGDPGLLRQVFMNLISNALKYTRPRRHACIEIGCSLSQDETIVSVRDNGVGFDMQHAGKLFGVFQRLHGSSEFEGTGIGLANVRRIIGRHGGRVWAEARVDEGATFFFSLPNIDRL
ncbi:MAG: PAS domain S-box protein [Verrucomicrobia bacterium]|nr:PAS domain S-box protein [Verrucomicrobiota bacterium]